MQCPVLSVGHRVWWSKSEAMSGTDIGYGGPSRSLGVELAPSAASTSTQLRCGSAKSKTKTICAVQLVEGMSVFPSLILHCRHNATHVLCDVRVRNPNAMSGTDVASRLLLPSDSAICCANFGTDVAYRFRCCLRSATRCPRAGSGAESDCKCNTGSTPPLCCYGVFCTELGYAATL
eukprot:3287809-Rhodomonas_salina.2